MKYEGQGVQDLLLEVVRLWNKVGIKLSLLTNHVESGRIKKWKCCLSVVAESNASWDRKTCQVLTAASFIMAAYCKVIHHQISPANYISI